MKITDELFIVGSGRTGFSLTDEFDCNIYLLNGETSLALVDTGAGRDVTSILNTISHEGFNPSLIEYIFVTHIHADHSGGLYPLSKIINFKSVLSHIEASYLEGGDEEGAGIVSAKRNGFLPEDFTMKPFTADIKIKGNENFKVGYLTVRTIALPGHTPGSFCYLMEGREKRYLFSGDTVFLHGYSGYIKGVGSSLEEYKKNIKKLIGLNIDLLMPGHDLFCFKNGQEHIDKVISDLESSNNPRSIIEKFPKQKKFFR